MEALGGDGARGLGGLLYHSLNPCLSLFSASILVITCSGLVLFGQSKGTSSLCRAYARYSRTFDRQTPVVARDVHLTFDSCCCLSQHSVVSISPSQISYGTWVWYGPVRQDSLEVLDWIDQQPWSNGRVALWGASYEGTSAFFTSLLRHPTVVGAKQSKDRRCEGYMRLRLVGYLFFT